MTQETVKITLTHPQAIDPAGSYRLAVLRPARIHGGDPTRQELDVPGHMLLDYLLGANRDPARLLGPPVVSPVLDCFSGETAVHWCLANELKGKLEAGGFVMLSSTGYVAPYGTLHASPLAAKAWSAWRRRAEAAAEQVAAKQSPQIEGADAIPENPGPALRRRSPWRKPTTEEGVADG